MPDGGITVRGIPEVQRNLAAFPRLLVLGCFSKALSRAIAVFEDEVRRNTPEGEYSTSSEDYGSLLENLVSKVTIDANGQGGKAQVSFGRKGFIALFVEYGHRMLSHKKQPTKLDRVKADPFMRQAFQSAADKALEAFTEEVQAFMQNDSIQGAQ